MPCAHRLVSAGSLLVEHVKTELLYGDPAYLARNAKSMFRKSKATALESLT
jgi:hypothetical protein